VTGDGINLVCSSVNETDERLMGVQRYSRRVRREVRGEDSLRRRVRVMAVGSVWRDDEHQGKQVQDAQPPCSTIIINVLYPGCPLPPPPLLPSSSPPTLLLPSYPPPLTPCVSLRLPHAVSGASPLCRPHLQSAECRSGEE
jgi:hypothetical protein